VKFIMVVVVIEILVFKVLVVEIVVVPGFFQPKNWEVLNTQCQFHQHFMHAIFVKMFVQSQTPSREKLLKRLLYEKWACKMLMKLTPSRDANTLVKHKAINIAWEVKKRNKKCLHNNGKVGVGVGDIQSDRTFLLSFIDFTLSAISVCYIMQQEGRKNRLGFHWLWVNNTPYIRVTIKVFVFSKFLPKEVF